MKLIEIEPGLFIQPSKVCAVREAKLSKNRSKTIVFCSGQSALDGGFLIDRHLDEVVEDIQDALDAEDARELEHEFGRSRYGR